MKSHAIGCGSTIVILALWVGGCTVLEYFDRPMFSNEFRRHPDRGILPQWWPFPLPLWDQKGTVALVDKRLNLLVLIATEDKEMMSSPVKKPVAGGVDLVLLDESRYFVPRESNVCLIYRRNEQTPQRIALREGNAAVFFEKMEADPSDFVEIIDPSPPPASQPIFGN